MAEKSIGKITQVISAVLDIKFPQGGLPEINDALRSPGRTGTLLWWRSPSILVTIR